MLKYTQLKPEDIILDVILTDHTDKYGRISEKSGITLVFSDIVPDYMKSCIFGECNLTNLFMYQKADYSICQKILHTIKRKLEVDISKNMYAMGEDGMLRYWDQEEV